ncbi:Nitrogen permease regulator 2 [Podospora pseudopauciseta]|uniref:Nitrogen permease regulator 2 n=1 Tax=Podospora pseudopauciseta TaxID=2093780 RepID=A0ABR0HWW1_9PEZI|nr:Nitrogen permease regulator 2 [Podospora pseudopauciseta]
MIQGIFYARFLPQEGTKIVAQSPPGCIVPVTTPSPNTAPVPSQTISNLNASITSSSTTPGTSTTTPAIKSPLFDFAVLSEYIIPREPFRNRYITVTDPDNKYLVLGFPVSIPDPRYHRNEFIFNFGLVVDRDVDQVPYERVVRRLAITFAEMERQSGYLSQDQTKAQEEYAWEERRDMNGDGGFFSMRRPIESLLEIIKEDLNNYGECMIPVDDANTINMKLFPYHPNPPEVKSWHVPVAKMKLADIVDPTWDLTLQKVIAHIDGVSDVRRIAFQADVSLELTQLALRHLLYYDTILLLDMFFFSACYAPRPGIHDFIANVDGIVDECANYVCVGALGIHSNDNYKYSNPRSSSTTTLNNNSSALNSFSTTPRSSSHHLSTSPSNLSPETHSHHPTSPFYNPSSSCLLSIERDHRLPNYLLIKLMTTFASSKTVMEWLKMHMDAGIDVLRYVDVRRLVQFGVIKGCLYRVHKHVVSKQYLASLATGQSRKLTEREAAARGGGRRDPLQKYTDGCHCFDEIITEMNMTDAEVMERLKGFRGAPTGDLAVLHR